MATEIKTGLSEMKEFLALFKKWKEDEFVLLRVQGKSLSEISATLGIPKSTCYRWDDILACCIYHKKIELYGETIGRFGYDSFSKAIQ